MKNLTLACLGACIIMVTMPVFAQERELTSEQLKKLLKRHPKADTDKNGKLTQEELRLYLSNTKSSKPGARTKDPAAVEMNTPIRLSGLSAKALPGKNILMWDDLLSQIPVEEKPANKEDVIAWAFSEGRGYYRVFRSCNLADGYHVLNLEGEVQEPQYADERLIPGVRYYYKVAAYRNAIEYGMSNPVEVIAKAGTRDPVEEGLWKTSTGRFALDEAIPSFDDIPTHGGMSGYTYGIIDRRLCLLYPSLPNKSPWPGGLSFEGVAQSRNLNGCLILGTVELDTPGSETPRYDVEYSGWDSLIYKTAFAGGKELTVYMNGLMPAITVHTDEPTLALFSGQKEVMTPPPAWVAFSKNGQVVSLPLSSQVNLEGMDRSWLLFWWGDSILSGHKGVDIPCLSVLSARPNAIIPEQGGIKLQFAKSARHVSLMPLYGISKKSTKGWENTLPEEIIQRAAHWEHRLKRIPVKCRDRFEIQETENRIRVELIYEYLDAPDDWGTESIALAPVAPTTAYVKRQGYPIQYESSVVSQNFACYRGPFEAAENASQVTYYLPAQMDAILQGYTPEIAHPELLPEIKKTLNADARVAAAITQGPSNSKRRPRTISMALAPYLTVYPILSEESRQGVEIICGNYLSENSYFDLSTYGFRRDRYSGKKYIVSLDPEQRSSTGITDYSLGAGPTLWTLYRYANVLGKWDEIRTHWDSVAQYGSVFEAGNGWNRQAPSGTTFTHAGNASPDFLMAHLQGHLALARMAHQLGDEVTYRRSVYQFSRTFLTYMLAWTLQEWSFEHQPHYIPRATEPPEEGYSFVATIRGEGGVYHFINSSSPIYPAVFWPLTRSCPDLAVFWDLYLRDTLAKYLYHDIPAICPNSSDIHTMLARAYLFENDPDTIRRWIDHASLHVGDWGSGHHSAAFMTMLCKPAVPIKPPDPKWIDPDYEARIAGKDHLYEMPPFDEINISEEKMRSFNAIWAIGQRDNSGREFSQEELSEASMIRRLATLRPDVTRLRTLILEHPELIEEGVAAIDNEIFTIGKNVAADWRYIHPSAWKVMGGAMSLNGRHHPRTVAFELRELIAEENYYFVADLSQLDDRYPLFMAIEVNGHFIAVRCPLPTYSSRDSGKNKNEGSADTQTILAFPTPAEWLKTGENRVTIHVEGAPRAYYDWFGFGIFP